MRILNRLYAAQSEINRAIVSTAERDSMLRKICKVLVETGGFSLVWIGWRDVEGGYLVPVCAHGPHASYVDGLEVRIDDPAELRGPAGTAIAEARGHVCNDILNDPQAVAWRERAAGHGFRALASFPFSRGGSVVGALNVYSDVAGFFREQEILLLTDTANDITLALDGFERERVRADAEERALVEREFSDSIIESMPGVMYLYDRSGRFMRWNRNFERISGYRADEIAQMRPGEFFLPEDREELARRVGAVFEEGHSGFEASFLTKDGLTLPYYFTGRRIEMQGEPCLVGVGVDISERVRAEAVLRDVNLELEAKVEERTAALADALAAAEGADRTKSAFLATMSHELRTPLNSILGFTGVLLQGLAGPLNEEQAKQLGMVRNSSRHLLDLINDVLDISKIEAGQFEVMLRPFEAMGAARRVVETQEPMAAAKGIQLTFSGEPDALTIVSDQRRFGQILLNLVNNAIKFTDDGGVSVTALLRGGLGADRLEVTVRDTGIGIAAEELPTLFKPFKQVRREVSRPGTGLGLAICKRLAAFLGGEILVASEEGKGSQFTLRVPIAPAEAAP